MSRSIPKKKILEIIARFAEPKREFKNEPYPPLIQGLMTEDDIEPGKEAFFERTWAEAIKEIKLPEPPMYSGKYWADLAERRREARALAKMSAPKVQAVMSPEVAAWQPTHTEAPPSKRRAVKSPK